MLKSLTISASLGLMLVLGVTPSFGVEKQASQSTAVVCPGLVSPTTVEKALATKNWTNPYNNLPNTLVLNTQNFYNEGNYGGQIRCLYYKSAEHAIYNTGALIYIGTTKPK